MEPESIELCETVLRLAKGMITAVEKWLKTKKK